MCTKQEIVRPTCHCHLRWETVECKNENDPGHQVTPLEKKEDPNKPCHLHYADNLNFPKLPEERSGGK